MDILERYSKVTPKTYNELKEYLDVIFEFKASDDFKSVLSQIDSLVVSQNRVWLLLGSNNRSDWECLQVAQTKKNIISEISEDVEFMLSYDYSKLIVELANDRRLSKPSTFYENAYEIDKDLASNNNERRKYSYSKMKEEYLYFRICILKVDEYLGLLGFTSDNDNIQNMIAIAKYLYAEAMIAYDMLAKYWNMYNSGVDGQAIMCFLEKQRNCTEGNP
jgi:hypothetical protein